MTSTTKMFKLNPALKNFWRTRRMYKLLSGGRASSKTQDAGGMATYLARNYSLRFLCIRQFQNRITDSVYTVLVEKIRQAGWEHEFDIQNTTIIHKETGSNFSFYGMARNTSDIKGFEGADICWIEEGEGLTEDQWSIIDPTIRKEGAEIWLLWNPRLATDFVQADLPKLLGKNYIHQHINYDQNPFLSGTMLEKIGSVRDSDREFYEHIYLGIPRSDDDSAIIKLSWVETAIDAHLKLDIDMTGARTVGYDVADDGGDRNCSVSFNGAIAQVLDAWKAGEDELKQSALRAWSMTGSGGNLVYDAIGNGAHVGSTLSDIEGTEGRYYKFISGGEVINPDDEYAPGITNKDKFENLKSQAWVDVADRLRNTYNAVTKGHKYKADELISICSDMNQLDVLKTELCMPHRAYSSRGLDMVEKKDKLKKRLGKSPDLADAFIMGACPHLTHTRTSSIWDFDLEDEYGY